MSDASDYRLLHRWRKYLLTLPLSERTKLAGFIFCGSRVRRDIPEPGIFVLRNEKEEKDAQSRLYGLTFCHSVWACPHCAPVVMSQKAARIAVAIEALEKKYNQIAVMVTFTLPHTRRIPCADTFTILKNTWRAFSKQATSVKTKKYTTKKSNENKTYRIVGTFAKIMQDLQIKHHVKVFEFTWGNNGWHPHIHALWWIPREKFNDIANYEEQIRLIWWETVKQQTEKYLRKKPLDESTMQYFKNVFAMEIHEMMTKTHSETFSISKNKDGKPRHQKSSYYSCGWSGDSELNTELKTANEGHMTPRQILEAAYNAKDETTEIKFMKLYTEYALATRGSRRVTFSPTGLNKIINEWKKTEAYIESVKKKRTALAIDKENWRIVCWFTQDDWYNIWDFEQNHCEFSIIAKILELAKLPEPKRRINLLFDKYNIQATAHDKKHEFADEITERINGVYAA